MCRAPSFCLPFCYSMMSKKVANSRSNSNFHH
jgi:hypothetical protein